MVICPNSLHLAQEGHLPDASQFFHGDRGTQYVPNIRAPNPLLIRFHLQRRKQDSATVFLPAHAGAAHRGGDVAYFRVCRTVFRGGDEARLAVAVDVEAFFVGQCNGEPTSCQELGAGSTFSCYTPRDNFISESPELLVCHERREGPRTPRSPGPRRTRAHAQACDRIMDRDENFSMPRR